MSNVIDFTKRFEQRNLERAQEELAYKESDENFLRVMAELDEINREAWLEIERERAEFLQFHEQFALRDGLDELSAKRWARERLQERDRWNDEINRKLGLTED
jgi:hypothetical protein